MRNFIRNLPVALLILLYAYAAASKLGDYRDFKGQLYNQTFPHAWADVLVILLPALELLTAGLLFHPKTSAAGLLLSIGLLTLFTGYIVLVQLHFWDRVPCSCGGILNKMSWTIHLFFNLFFILLNLAAIRTGRQDNPLPDEPPPYGGIQPQYNRGRRKP